MKIHVSRTWPFVIALLVAIFALAWLRARAQSTTPPVIPAVPAPAPAPPSTIPATRRTALPPTPLAPSSGVAAPAPANPLPPEKIYQPAGAWAYYTEKMQHIIF